MAPVAVVVTKMPLPTDLETTAEVATLAFTATW
jgi:hypothetical protein